MMNFSNQQVNIRPLVFEDASVVLFAGVVEVKLHFGVLQRVSKTFARMWDERKTVNGVLKIRLTDHEVDLMLYAQAVYGINEYVTSFTMLR